MLSCGRGITMCPAGGGAKSVIYSNVASHLSTVEVLACRRLKAVTVDTCRFWFNSTLSRQRAASWFSTPLTRTPERVFTLHSRQPHSINEDGLTTCTLKHTMD